MEPGPLSGGTGRAPTDAAWHGRRRAGARADGAVRGRWAWLSELPGSPIRLTPANTSVSIAVRWLGGLIVRGRFEELQGTIHVPVYDDDTAAVTVEVRTASVRTGIALRDRHLRGPMFLDAERHPVITFRGSDAMRLPTHVAVPGSLTIRGVMRTEEVRCSVDGIADAGELVGSATLSRRAYGVGVPQGLRRLDPLFVLIGDEVKVSIRVRL